MTIGKCHFSALVDSGATHSFISERAVCQLGLKPVDDVPLEVKLADDTSFSCSQSVVCTVGLVCSDGTWMRHKVKFRVAKDLHNACILGVDWLHEFNPQIDWVHYVVNFGHRGNSGSV